MVAFLRQYAQIRVEILAAIEKVCERQQFILGPEVAEFEVAAAAFCHAKNAIGCASGTDALWLAMAAAKIGPGDAILTSPFSFFATVSSILRVGAKPVLADIDPATYNLDPNHAKTILRNDQTVGGVAVRAVLPVHLYGQCADWDAFSVLKDEFGILTIEDAAQAFGAKWRDRPAGSLGDMAAFSFYPTKNLSAYGEAGMVTTGSTQLAERMRMLRVHGMRQRYLHDEVGWNSRLDTIQAAILLVKLRHVERWNEERQKRARIYFDLFKKSGLTESGLYPDHGVVPPHVDSRGTHVYHQFVIRAPRRDALKAHLKKCGIGSEIYYPQPLHLQAAMRNLGYLEGSFPESERAAKEVLALPMFPELTLEEQVRVVDAIADFLS